MGNLGDSLLKHAKRLGIERQVEAVGVVELATAEIKKIIPEEDFEVISFKDGILKVGTTSGSASSTVRMTLKRDFLEEYKIKRLLFI
jgi:hypothetical protein